MTITANRRAELRRLSKTMDIEPERDRPVDYPFLRDDVCESPWWYVTDVTGEKLIACANEEHAEFVAAAIAAVPSLLDEIDRLTQLAAERYEETEELHALVGEPTQSSRPTIAGLRLQLSIATELNVNDRKQIEKLEARQQELLATIVRLTNETPFPDEIKGWEFQRAKMLTEIGTLRSRVAELDTALSVANVVAGEAALVLDQQDRDLARIREALEDATNWIANRTCPDSVLVDRLRKVLG